MDLCQMANLIQKVLSQCHSPSKPVQNLRANMYYKLVILQDKNHENKGCTLFKHLFCSAILNYDASTMIYDLYEWKIC